MILSKMINFKISSIKTIKINPNIFTLLKYPKPEFYHDSLLIQKKQLIYYFLNKIILLKYIIPWKINAIYSNFKRSWIKFSFNSNNGNICLFERECSHKKFYLA